MVGYLYVLTQEAYTDVAPDFWRLSGPGQFVCRLSEHIARRLVREARGEFAAHARVRIAYAHVQNDLARFTHRVGLLEQETARAEAAGLETTRAAAQATIARADLAAVEAGLAGVDAGNTGPVVLAQIRAAHREAHSAQWHLRAGFGSLVDQAL